MQRFEIVVTYAERVMDSHNTTSRLAIEGMAPLLQVYDMPASLRFYRDVLGFSVVQSSGTGDDVDWVLLDRGGIRLMLNTAYEKEARPKVPDAMRRSAHSDTSLYFGCPDVEAAYSYLVSTGMHLEKPKTTGYGWKAIYFSDPDGYLLCFHWPSQDGKIRSDERNR